MPDNDWATDADFADLVGGMMHDDLPASEPEVEEATPEEPQESTEPAADTPAEEPEEAEEIEAAEEQPEAEGDDAPEAEAEEVEEAAPEEESYPAPEGYFWKDGQLYGEIIVDGQRFEATAEEVRKGYMRQADYTRKTQAVAEHERQVAEALTDQRNLVGELQQSDRARTFIDKHPDSVEFFLAKPEATRRLLRNSREFDAFAQDYEIMANNPKLARAYLESDENPEAAARVEEGRAEEQLRREAEQLTQFAYALDEQVANLAKSEFADDISEQDVQEVLEYLSGQIGGFAEGSSPDAVLAGMRKLVSVCTTSDQSDWDLTLVRDRFNAMKSSREREANSEAAKAAEHNKAVETELAEQSQRPPDTPSGSGAIAEAEKVEPAKTYEEVFNKLSGHG